MEQIALHEGDARVIRADTPAQGYVFDQWTGDTAYVDDPLAAVTIVTMPAADVEVTATYQIDDCMEYGLLYNWYVTQGTGNASLTSTDDWSVSRQTTTWDPNSDAQILANNIGGIENGYHLKEAGLTYWNTPNTNADNSYSFNARGAGSRMSSTGAFIEKKIYLDFWTNREVDSTLAFIAASLSSGSTSMAVSGSSVIRTGPKNTGISIRLIYTGAGTPTSYTGNDGKVYRVVTIGTQIWLADNLAETKYRDGSSIPEVTNGTTWSGLTTGALCAYDNDWANVGCGAVGVTTTTTTTVGPFALVVAGGSGASPQYSVDKTNWVGSTLADTYGGPIIYANNKWYAFANGMSRNYYTSTNGINWSSMGVVPIDSTQGTYDVCWTGKNYVICGQGSTLCDIAVSTDGITWTNKYKLASGMAQALACYDDYVLCGGSLLDLYSTDDGESWTAFTLSNVTDMYAACYNGSIWVIVGRGTSHTISTASGLPHLGTTGRGKTIFTTGGEDVAWNGSMFVAVGSGTNHAAYSYNGIDWTPLGLFTDISVMYDVKWDGDTWWMCGGVSTTAKGVFKSTNGIDWSPVAADVSSGFSLYTVGTIDQPNLYPALVSGLMPTTTTTTTTV